MLRAGAGAALLLSVLAARAWAQAPPPPPEAPRHPAEPVQPLQIC